MINGKPLLFKRPFVKEEPWWNCYKGCQCHSDMGGITQTLTTKAVKSLLKILRTALIISKRSLLHFAQHQAPPNLTIPSPIVLTPSPRKLP